MGSKLSTHKIFSFGNKKQFSSQVGVAVSNSPTSHGNKTSSWIPPPENWDLSSCASQNGMPYGWEIAKDNDGKEYFINHLTKTTTYDDPRREVHDDNPKAREVILHRDQEYGFGFVAGSEKPVIVRFVTEGGPSVDKLLAGDQIWMINGEDVRKAPREHVIQLVRSCKETVYLTVCQPPLDNSSRKSALLSAAKKAKLKCNPSRVRFAEGVLINGSPFSNTRFAMNGSCPGVGGGGGVTPELSNGSVGGGESCVPLMPNVLKVFLENGQTKSFKYDGCTTVQDVLESLQQKLTVRCIQHFALVVEHCKSLRRNKLTLLDPDDPLCRIASQPGAHNLRCLFRVTFVPKDACELLRKDPVAFEYLYMQCCNDVVHERFAPELKYDIALRLAALHIYQHALANNLTGKLSIKAIEKEFGLERFVPSSLAETMKRKELRKLLQHFLKSNSGLVPAGQKALTALQAKLHYLRIIGELPSYGAKCFATNLRQDSSTESVLLVSPKFGISQISGIRNSVPFPVCDIENAVYVDVVREDELSCRVEIKLKDPDRENFVVSLEERDADELILVLKGYYYLLTGHHLIVNKEEEQTSQTDLAPCYHSQHRVLPSSWSYVPSLSRAEDDNCSQVIDLTLPPPYNPNAVFEPIYDQRVAPAAHFTSSANTIIPNGQVVIAPNSHLIIDSFPPPPPCSSAMAVQVGAGDKDYMVDRNMNKTSASNLNMSEQSSPRSPQISRLNMLSQHVPTSCMTIDNGMYPPNGNLSANSTLLRSPRMSSKIAGGGGMDSPTAGGKQQHQHGYDIQSVVSMEILESTGDMSDGSGVNSDIKRKISPDERALKRVAEMRQLVEDAENYLTDHETADTLSLRSSLSQTDSDGSSATAAGQNAVSHLGVSQLRHGDSILLMSQEGDGRLVDAVNLAVEQIRAMAIGETEPSESDTDSICTPTESPARRPPAVRPMLKTSDSSFGLHSPDTFPNGPYKNQDFQDMLKKLQEEHAFPYNFAEGTLYLDPDIIDLTMIPPPITPEEEGFKPMPNPLSTPPTPFADRMTLEAELKALESGGTTLPQFWLHSYAQANGQKLEGFGYDDQSRGDKQWKYQDIDSFISMTTLPPPPDLSEDSSSAHVTHVGEDLSNLIIPPPPLHVGQGDDDTISIDSTETLKSGDNKISSKIALLQAQLKKSPDEPIGSPRDENGPQSKISIAERRAIFLGITSPHGAENTKLMNGHKELLMNGGFGKSNSQHNLFDNECGINVQYTDRNGMPFSTSEEALAHSFPTGLMGTSSDDSLNSTTSCATVKSVDMAADKPPALPPKSPPGTPSNRPPAVPSRLRKPASPETGLQNGHHGINGGLVNGSSGENAPKAPYSPKMAHGYLNGSASNEEKERLGISQSPLASRKNGHILNGTLGREYGSKDSGAHDSESSDNRLITPSKLRYGDGKQVVIPYGTMDDLLGNVVHRLEEIISQCGAAHIAGGGIYMNDEKFQLSKEALAAQARQLVTASKLFVKSVTEDCSGTNGMKRPSAVEVKEKLDSCVTLLEKMTEISEDVVHYTSTPLQTQNLLVRVRAVAHAFRLSVQAAAQIIERKPNDDFDALMTPLMERATLLAADLSALLRTLRVFAP